MITENLAPKAVEAVPPAVANAPRRPTLEMQLHAGQFQDVRDDRPVRLTAMDLREVERLLETEPSAFLGSALENLSAGVYFGVRAAGKLVACAGTVLHAPSQGVAALGNVITHPDYRGLGLATACTAAVAREALRSCAQVRLTVDSASVRAIRVYERLGFAVLPVLPKEGS